MAKRSKVFRLHGNKRSKRFQHKKKDEWINDLYRSAEWKRYRKAFLEVNKKCCECDAKATVVDHISSVKRAKSDDEKLRLFWDTSNHQPMCAHHHNKKTATMDGGFGNQRKVNVLILLIALVSSLGKVPQDTTTAPLGGAYTKNSDFSSVVQPTNISLSKIENFSGPPLRGQLKAGRTGTIEGEKFY